MGSLFSIFVFRTENNLTKFLVWFTSPIDFRNLHGADLLKRDNRHSDTVCMLTVPVPGLHKRGGRRWWFLPSHSIPLDATTIIVAQSCLYSVCVHIRVEPVMSARRQVQWAALAPPLNFAVQDFFINMVQQHSVYLHDTSRAQSQT